MVVKVKNYNKNVKKAYITSIYKHQESGDSNDKETSESEASSVPVSNQFLFMLPAYMYIDR